MFFRKRKKKFTTISTFQDSSSGWDSGAIRPQRLHNKGEMYQITFEMMKKGSTNLRSGKQVRQFGVMVGTDLKLVTSGDMVDRETYEALLSVDAIDAPNRQMSIPGIASDNPSPPPRPSVPEVMQHVNPVHHEVVGIASVRPMRRKVEEQTEAPRPSVLARGAMGAAPVREIPPTHDTLDEKPTTPPVRDLPNEIELEKLDAVVPPAPMPEDTPIQELHEAEAVEVVVIEEEMCEVSDGLPPEDFPEGLDQEADDAFDLPPVDMPDGVDMEEEPEVVYVIDEVMDEIPIEEVPPIQAQDAPAEVETPTQEIEAEEEPSTPESVQTELLELLGEKSPTTAPKKGKQGRQASAKKQRGKKR